jgi:hypothetical protein
MSLESDLQTYMLAETDITNLVGLTGVYWGRAPQDREFPYITFSLISEDRNDGADMADQCGYVEAIYQFDCVHRGSGDVLAVGEAVRTTLAELAKVTMGSTYIQAIDVVNRIQRFDVPEFGQEETVDIVSIDLRITFNESVPVHA